MLYENIGEKESVEEQRESEEYLWEGNAMEDANPYLLSLFDRILAR